MADEQTVESRKKPEESESTTKVGRLIEKYDLGEEFGAELEMRWTADDDDRMSLRSLADRFNRRIIEEAMIGAGMSTLDGEVENLYRLLISDDVSSGKKTEARNWLGQADIDVDQLETDFVTYQAIRSYLQNERGAEYNQKSDSTRLSNEIDSVQRLKSRTSSVTEGTVSRLRNAGIITLGDFRVFVDVSVHCEDCDTQFGVINLLRNKGCNCKD